jgi:hypothetical protein
MPTRVTPPGETQERRQPDYGQGWRGPTRRYFTGFCLPLVAPPRDAGRAGPPVRHAGAEAPPKKVPGLTLDRAVRLLEAALAEPELGLPRATAAGGLPHPSQRGGPEVAREDLAGQTPRHQIPAAVEVAMDTVGNGMKRRPRSYHSATLWRVEHGEGSRHAGVGHDATHPTEPPPCHRDSLPSSADSSKTSSPGSAPGPSPTPAPPSAIAGAMASSIPSRPSTCSCPRSFTAIPPASTSSTSGAGPSPAGAYCQARKRLPLAVWQHLLEGTAARLRRATDPESRWRGHRVWTVDGSSFSMPDAPALRQHFGQPPSQRPGCGGGRVARQSGASGSVRAAGGQASAQAM